MRACCSPVPPDSSARPCCGGSRRAASRSAACPRSAPAGPGARARQIAIGDLADPPLVPPRAARRAHRRAPGRLAARPAARDDRGAQRARRPGGCCGRPSAPGSSTSCSSRVLGASPHHRSRAAPRQGAGRAAVVGRRPAHRPRFAPSLVYAPGDRACAARAARVLPAVPLAGRGRARTQPIWAEDVADCVIAALDRPPGGHAALRAGRPGHAHASATIVALALRAAGRRRRARPRPAARVLRAAPARLMSARPARPRAPPGTRPSCWRSRCAPRAGPPTPSARRPARGTSPTVLGA